MKAAYGVQHALLVGPNSGYGTGNRCPLDMLADLDLLVQVQVGGDQLLALMPMLERSGVRILVDHCSRPDVRAGVGQSWLQAWPAPGRNRRAIVKPSCYQKFSTEPPPYLDTRPFALALIDAFTLDACLWASDWPFVKATRRLNCGPLLSY